VLILLLLLELLASLKPIHTQVVHRWVAQQCQIPLPCRWITFTAEPPSKVPLLILGCHNKPRSACMDKGTHTAPSFTMPSPSSTPCTSGFNGRAHRNPSGNFQPPYTTIAYTDPVPLPGRSLGFFPTTPIKPCHVSMPMANQKPTALVMKPHHNSLLDHNQLTWRLLEPQPSPTWTLTT
jgi:hypothetical protein